MEMKFRKNLSEYKWLIMFDLASKTSGVCVWDLEAGRPASTQVLKTKDTEANRPQSLWDELDRFFLSFVEEHGEDALGNVVVHRELCPLQQGRFTTAKTLIALGKAHAVLDLYLALNGIDYYDTDGISPSTTHAYFRRLRGLPVGAKVEKTDVRDYLVSEYGIDPHTGLDESDAVFLAKTFVDVFWDKEIDERAKELKKHAKTLKMKSAIDAVMAEIEGLKAMKRGG